MTEPEHLPDRCVPFLQWALPRMGMRWPGFRKVRRQVCRRIRARIAELGLAGFAAYGTRLESDPEEWARLAFLCRVTISRFARDRGVFEVLERRVLPELAAHTDRIRAWSAGCASGEEPYTLQMAWRFGPSSRFPGTRLEIVATDVDPLLLSRARTARYPSGALRDLDPERLAAAFERVSEDTFELRPELRETVRWLEQDVRAEMPPGPFHIVLCRNLVFTYFDEDEQRRLLEDLLARLLPGGALVLGAHERLPHGSWPLERWSAAKPVFRRLERRPGATSAP